MTARQKCIELAKKLAKERDGYRCVRCNRGKDSVQIQGAHIFPVTFGNTAADPENIIALCSSCHQWARDSWHNSPLEAAAWFNERYPGHYELLRSRAYPIRPIKKFEWEALLIQLRR